MGHLGCLGGSEKRQLMTMSTSNPETDAVQGTIAPPELVPNLALIRTDLANERTLLAYGRTSLMLAGTGVSLIKFLDRSFDLVLLGWGLMAVGLLVGAVGVYRFTRLKRALVAAHQG